MPAYSDPFQEARNATGVMKCPFHGEDITMILRHEDVRRAAKDWSTFSSDAPFRVPIPSEEQVRSMRQLPIETDPPEHTEYRAIVEPFFQRSKEPETIAKVEALIERMLTQALDRQSIEVVSEFAVPLQSHALTYLLNMPETEAQTWIAWGIHVFRVGHNEFKSGNTLEDYLRAKFAEAEAHPGEDLFSALTQAIFRGRKLTPEERLGFANLVFAGGRDTIIHTVSSAIGYLGEHPEALEFLREDPKRIVHASEEIFRVFMPLTHIGRVCPEDTDVNGVTVKAGERVSLCWSSANFDENAFSDPLDVKLDRKPNPHLSFGFGTHLCLGAPHARLIMRTLLRLCCERVKRIEILEAKEQVERQRDYDRTIAYDALRVKMLPL